MVAAELPPGFRSRMEDLLGAEAEELFATLDSARQPAVRLNDLRGDLERLAALLPWPGGQVPWCPAGRALEAESAEVAAHPLNDAGVYYQQDPAAMGVAEAVAPRSGELVVDLAAAPGGKSTHLAALAGDDALVVANDVDERRARALLGNVERLGVTGAVVTNARPERLAAALGGACDAVLLDAPCSGEGMFRRSAAAREAWSEAGVERHAELQRRLIAVAAALVRPGGRLVYSTCTFDPREDEEVVLWLLGQRDDLEVEPLDLPGAQDAARFGLPGAARFWPHRALGDGHFVARLRRAPGAEAEGGSGAPSGPHVTRRSGPGLGRRASGTKGSTSVTAGEPDAATRAAWGGFAAERLGPAWLERADGRRLARYGDRLLLLPRAFRPLPGVHVLRAGLHLADVGTGRGSAPLTPSHALAMSAGFAAGGWTGERIELSDGSPDLAAYLAGGSFTSGGEDAQLALVTHSGFALGWAARKGGEVRSLLPRGLRRQAG